jgi:hypothetical protein
MYIEVRLPSDIAVGEMVQSGAITPLAIERSGGAYVDGNVLGADE